MLLPDYEIKKRIENEMLYPATKQQDKENMMGTGISSHGYDLRLSEKEFLVFQHTGNLIDPKCFDRKHLFPLKLQEDDTGKYFIFPSQSYALGTSIERLKIPREILATAVSKSTYARSGIAVNVSPAESEFEGHLTLEFANLTPDDCKIYANEGVCQLLFIETDPPEESYRDRSGKYQKQEEEVVVSKV